MIDGKRAMQGFFLTSANPNKPTLGQEHVFGVLLYDESFG